MRRALVLAAALLALLPPAAQAKTFKAFTTDPEGDVKSGQPDLISTRFAYNRRLGAISITVTTSAPIAGLGDAVVAIALSDLRGGKCKKPILYATGTFAKPDTVYGQASAKGKVHRGHGTVDGATYSMRVRNKALAGKTVGCAYAALLTVPKNESDKPKLIDETANNVGFV